ncbi:MAG: hypothetical protein ACOX2O_00025 [Bdellovibrionota bacterium]|jgi:hypothetical protein
MKKYLPLSILGCTLLYGAPLFAASDQVCFFLNEKMQVDIQTDRSKIPYRSPSQCLSKNQLQDATRRDPYAKIGCYMDSRNRFNVKLLSDVPQQYKASATQGSMFAATVLQNIQRAGETQLAKPDEIDLEGTVRQVNMSSAVGRIKLRWPRKVELLFGRTPERAMAEAANTVSRTLKQAGFPTKLRTLNMEWNVVFMDEEMSETQIPAYLRQNCHPGWMTPPSNIYIVAQRVATGCSGRSAPSNSVTDAKLAEVLLHEMGHAVEAQLLGSNFGGDKMRAEGFATWFEMFAARQSSLVSSSALQSENRALAKRSIAQSPNEFRFSGSAEDYARASLYFQAVVSRRGVKGLMDVYDTMLSSGVDFLSALKSRMYWSDKKLKEETERILKN